MTTKAKIIIGFSLMISLIAALAVVGFLTASNSQNGFVEYQRLARFNTAASDMVAELYDATGDINAFMNNRDVKAVEKAKAAVIAADNLVLNMQELAVRDDVKSSMQAMGERVRAYTAKFNAIQDAVHDADNYYTTTLVNLEDMLQEKYATFTRASERAQDVTGLVLITDALNRLADASTSATRYSSTRNAAEIAQFAEYAKEMRASIKNIEANVVSERGKQLMRELQAVCDDYINGFAVLVEKNRRLENIFSTMSSDFQQDLEQMSLISSARDDEMHAFGDAMRASNAKAKSFSMILGVLGLLLGGLVAFVIVRGLSKVLHNLSEFATRVSQGEFSVQPNVKEGGDIGIMVAAMQEIPAVINKVMDGAKVLCTSVLAGDFRARMDVGEYHGGFAELATTVNTVGNVYTGVLDLMPLPITTGDPNKRLRFLNTAAQTMMNGNPVGESCAEFIKSGVCNSSKCFGDNCMNSGASVSGEMDMNPDGGRMDAHVTAIPLMDESNSLVGYIEIMNDITEIKNKQTTILRVANEASEIADRVAAASEEIATQVEQISRGADVQRERVESTASAMTEMNSTVLEVARSAGQASEQSETTRTKAEGGAQLVRQVVNSIQTVNTVTQTMQQNMEELGAQAENIGGVMNVISDIADQTNLLALNAAIEAARAGEAGRGFAVVADSVRQLAEKTMLATQEVGHNISAMQTSTRKNIESMSEAAKGVADAATLATSSGEALTEIVSLASDNSSVVTSIATAAEEQSATSEEITRAIDEINHVIGETTEGMNQSAHAVQELSQMAQELRNIISSMH